MKSYRQILTGGLLGGTTRPTEDSRGFGGAYRNLSDAEFNFAVAVCKPTLTNDKLLLS